MAISVDSKWLVTGSNDNSARLWEMSSGKEVRAFKGLSPVNRVSLSNDCKWLAAVWTFRPRVWDMSNGTLIQSFKMNEFNEAVHSVALNGDATWVVMACEDGVARLCEVATGKEIRSFRGHTKEIYSVALSGDEKWLVTASRDKTARMWNIATGQEVRRFEGHTDAVYIVSLSADGKRLLTYSSDGTSRLWEVASGQEVRRFNENVNGFSPEAISGNAKWLIGGCGDRAIGISSVWGPDNDKELCQLISFRDGTWAVMDQQGRYDASNNGDIPHLHWVVGMETFPLKQFADRYYDPGLLAKHLGLHKERPREINRGP